MTSQVVPGPRPFRFSVRRGERQDISTNQILGEPVLYWLAGLNDGREVKFYAETVEIRDGAVIARGRDGHLLFSIAPGMWTDVYSASVMDDSPIAVERLEAPR